MPNFCKSNLPDGPGVDNPRLLNFATGSNAGEHPSSPDRSLMDVALSRAKLMRLLRRELNRKGLQQDNILVTIASSQAKFVNFIKMLLKLSSF